MTGKRPDVYIHSMKLFCAALLGFVAFSSVAQTKEQDEKAFLNALNQLLQVTRAQHWAYDVPFTTDSAFHIIDDTLSATFRYQNDSMTFRIRYAAPVSRIREVVHDIYLILEFDSRCVNVYEQIDKQDWVRIEKRGIFHIGEVDLENAEQWKLKEAIEKAWEKYAAWLEQ